MSDSDVPLLQNLLSKDRSQGEAIDQPEALSQVFGDVFLCQNNRLFWKIRKTALAMGYRYSNERGDDYEALPFTKLEDLLETKTIPIVHNRRAVETVSAKVPEATWLDIADGFRRCFAFHESCHAIARETLRPDNLESESTSERVLRTMLEESFANTCELVGLADCHDLSALAFYEANSYTALWETKDLLENTPVNSEALKFVLLHYLRANFLADPDVTSDELDLVYEISGAKRDSALEDLAQFAYTLDENFRHTTSRLHLRLHGLPIDLEARDPVQELSKSPELQIKIQTLIGLAVAN